MFLYKIKVIDVLRDAARAPQPPTNQPTESEEKAILESGLFLTLGSGTSIAQNWNFLLITFIKDTVLRSINVESRTNIQRDNNCTIIMSLLRHNDSAPRMAASAYHPLLSRHRTTGWRSAEGCQCHGGSPRVGGCGEREEWGPKRKSKTTFEYKHTPN